MFSCRALPYCSGNMTFLLWVGAHDCSLISSGTAVLAGSRAELSSSQALCFKGKKLARCCWFAHNNSWLFLPLMEPELHVDVQAVQDVMLAVRHQSKGQRQDVVLFLTQTGFLKHVFTFFSCWSFLSLEAISHWSDGRCRSRPIFCTTASSRGWYCFDKTALQRLCISLQS